MNIINNKSIDINYVDKNKLDHQNNKIKTNKAIVNKLSFIIITIVIFLLKKEEYNPNVIIIVRNRNLSLILLTLIIITISFKENFNYRRKKDYFRFSSNKISIIILCLIVFCSEDKLRFFIFFESSIIPIIIIIFFLRKSKEKIESAIYIIIIRIRGSVPFIIYIFGEMKEKITLISNILNLEQEKRAEIIIIIIIIIMILTKIPLFILHVWLPKAHVEASTIGSIILAGIILKLGISGLIKYTRVMEEKIKSIKETLIITSWFSVFYCIVVSMRSNDIKKIAAISSITHIGMTTNSFITIKENGFIGGILITVCHGLVSSVMFLLIGSIYENCNRRRIFSNKNIERIEKQIRLLWVRTIFMNVGIPPIGRFLSEVFILISFARTTILGSIFMICSIMLISSVAIIFITKIIFFKSKKNSNMIIKTPIKLLTFILSSTLFNLVAIKIV